MKYLVKKLARQNCIPEEIQRILNQGMLAIIWSSIICVEMVIGKLKIYDINNYNFVVLLYGCETWSPTLREEHRPSVLCIGR